MSATSQSESEVFARLLLPRRQGYPLWIPEPNGYLPLEYRETGVRIGDVGIITPDGGFDFLFNICHPASDPINSNGVPESFVPLVVESKDIFDTQNMYDLNSYIASVEMRRTSLTISGSTNENPLIPASFGAGFCFNCSSSEGAMIFLPNGGSRQDLRKLKLFQRYALEHGVQWYQYVNGPLGREATDGSIYLITGWDKAKTWGLASFSNMSDENGVTLSFKAVSAVEASISGLYSWETLYPASVRTGPSSTDSILRQNQCVFLRGYRVSVQKKWLRVPSGIAVAAESLAQLRAKDILQKRRAKPFSYEGSSQWSFFRRGENHNPGNGDDDYHSGDEGEQHTFIEHVPNLNSGYHPADVLNTFLLENHPNCSVAVTHDDDWAQLLTASDIYMPDDEELKRRFCGSFGCGYECDGIFPDHKAPTISSQLETTPQDANIPVSPSYRNSKSPSPSNIRYRRRPTLSRTRHRPIMKIQPSRLRQYKNFEHVWANVVNGYWALLHVWRTTRGRALNAAESDDVEDRLREVSSELLETRLSLWQTMVKQKFRSSAIEAYHRRGNELSGQLQRMHQILQQGHSRFAIMPPAPHAELGKLLPGPLLMRHLQRSSPMSSSLDTTEYGFLRRLLEKMTLELNFRVAQTRLVIAPSITLLSPSIPTFIFVDPAGLPPFNRTVVLTISILWYLYHNPQKELSWDIFYAVARLALLLEMLKMNEEAEQLRWLAQSAFANDLSNEDMPSASIEEIDI
ncbi:hypothetical protein HGRIS_006833 [Hohenbuehelia grisea]|uniref:Uncharacterized protein n=1 Tax=Hohenbuehelia grisea TaxID=104357 RepID=A0ABR3JAR2_9AGAR